MQLHPEVDGGDLLQEAEEFLVPVAGVAGVGGGLAGGELQGGEQHGGAVAPVATGAALGQAGAQREYRGGPVRCLDLRLLVHRDHDGVVRRGQVQADDVADLGRQFRVGAELEGLDAVRTDVPPVLGPGHRGERDTQFGGQEPGRPVRDPQPFRRPAVVHQRRGDDLDLVDLRQPAGPACILHRGNPVGLVTLLPGDHRQPRHADHPGDLCVRHPISCQAGPSVPASPDSTARSAVAPDHRTARGYPRAALEQELKDMLHCPAHHIVKRLTIRN